MRIAITSDLYYPMTNGVAVFTHNLARGLAERKHEVIVLCPSFTGKKHKVRQDGVTIVYLPSMRFPFYPDQINEVPRKKEILGVSMPRLGYRYGLWVSVDPYPEIKKALDRFRPEVIHSQTPGFGVAFSTQRYARHRGIPLVSTGHSYPDNLTGQLKLLKPLKKPLDLMMKPYFMNFLKHAEYATMPTEIAIDDLVPKNQRRFKVPVEPLSNGVDLKSFTPGEPKAKTLKKFHLENGRPRALYVGRVDPEKSIGQVITAFAEVLEKIPDAELVVVGDGTDRAHLNDLVTSFGIQDSVKFLGRVMFPEIVELYRSADLFVTASETETQGIVLIEAAAIGLPLVAVDAGAVRELCQNRKNGILCRPRHADEIAAAMIEILNNKKIQQKYSQASLKIAQKHDLNRTLTRFVEIYDEAIRLKGQRKHKSWWKRTTN